MTAKRTAARTNSSKSKQQQEGTTAKTNNSKSRSRSPSGMTTKIHKEEKEKRRQDM
jgi:hypothetical protein